MSKINLALVLLLALPTIAFAQPRAELMIGWLRYSGGTINQVLSVRNNGILPIRSVKIGCRFFRDEKLLRVSGSVEIKNVAPDAIGYNSISIRSKISPDQADCQVLSVK